MKTQTTEKTYGQPAMGCYLDQANRNSTDHDVATIRVAMDLGFVPDREMAQLMARADNDVLSEERDDSGMLSESADEAIEWLNGQETRSFMYWANDGDRGAFGLWCNVDGAREDVGFVSGGEDCSEEDSDYPADDYRGEWLHVSDHGNATLYVREEVPMQPDGAGMTNFRDVEIWSVV